MHHVNNSFRSKIYQIIQKSSDIESGRIIHEVFMLYYKYMCNCSKMVEMTGINHVKPKTLLNNFGWRCVMSIFCSLISDFQVDTINR